jgi:hypothetical protein
MTEQEIEQEIQAAGANVAPRLCPEDIDAVIISKTFTLLSGGKTLVCELVLRNGFIVIGKSALVCVENDVPAIGERIAYDEARDRVWELEGYLLQERIYQSTQPAQIPQ